MSLTPKPTIQLVDVTKLRPWDRNPRTITEERFNALKRHLEAEPEMLRARPLIALPNGRCVAGNMRQRAAAALVDEGSTRFLEAYPKGRVPTFVVDLDEARATQWAIRDNAGYGEDDEQLLAELLYELEQAGNDLDLTGLEEKVRTQLLDSVSGLKNPHRFPDDPAPPRPAKPKSQPGTIYELGEHRLLCGDATNAEHVARVLGDDKPRLMVTDPPYGVELDLSWHDKKTKNVKRLNTKIEGDTRVDWSEAYELVPSIDIAYVWHGGTTAHVVAAGLERIGFNIGQQIIWDKINFALSRSQYQWQHETAFYAARVGQEIPWYGPAHGTGVYARRKGSKLAWLGDHTQTTVWQAPSPKRHPKDAGPDDDDVDHPTQKPALLWTRPIQNHTQRGDAIYEPFAGSGTALIAAEATGRRCLALELDPAFCDVIRQRYAEFLGEEKWAP